MERQVMPPHLRLVAIIHAANCQQESKNVFYKTLPVKENIKRALTCVPECLKKPIELKTPLTLTTSGSGLMTIKRLTNQKSIK